MAEDGVWLTIRTQEHRPFLARLAFSLVYPLNSLKISRIRRKSIMHLFTNAPKPLRRRGDNSLIWTYAIWGIGIVLCALIVSDVLRGGLVDGSDLDFPLRPDGHWLARFFSAWAPTIGMGQDFTRGLPQLPCQALIVGLFSLTHSLIATQATLFGLMMLLSPASFAYAARGAGVRSGPALFVGAVIYSCSPLLISQVWANLDLLFLQIAAGPFFVGAVLRYIASGGSRNLLMVAVSSISTSASGNEMFVVAYVLLISMGTLLASVTARRAVPVWHAVAAFVVVGLANGFWVIPTLMELSSDYKTVIASAVGQSPWQTLQVVSTHASIAHVFEGTPNFWFFTTYLGSPYAGFASLYENPLVRTVIFGATVLALLIVVSRRYIPKRVWILLTIFISSILLIKGAHTPWGAGLFGVIFNIPLGKGFRDPMDIFAVPLAMTTALLGAFAFELAPAANSRRLLGGAVLFASFFAILPLAENTAIRPRLGTGVLPAQRIAVPQYYDDLNSVPIFQRRGRYLPYPYTENFYSDVFKMGQGYLGPSPDRQLIRNRGIFITSNPLPLAAGRALASGNRRLAEGLMADLGVDYILTHSDLDVAYLAGSQFTEIGTPSELSTLHLRPALTHGAITLWRPPLPPMPPARLTSSLLTYRGDVASIAFIRDDPTTAEAAMVSRPLSPRLDVINSLPAQQSPDCQIIATEGPCSPRRGRRKVGKMFIPYFIPRSEKYNLYDEKSGRLLEPDVKFFSGHGALRVRDVGRGGKGTAKGRASFLILAPDSLIRLSTAPNESLGVPKLRCANGSARFAYRAISKEWVLRLATGDAGLRCRLTGRASKGEVMISPQILSARQVFFVKHAAVASAVETQPIKVADKSWYEAITIPRPLVGHVLVLSNGYDAGWSLFKNVRNTMPLFAGLLPGAGLVASHILVDGYANGWVLRGTVPRRIIAVYRPELGFALGGAVGICLVLVLLFLAYFERR